MPTKTKILLLALSLFVVFAISFYSFISKERLEKSISVEIGEAPVLAGLGANVFGWAWSDNIGWISFNSADCDFDNNGFRDTGNCGGDNSITTPSFNYGVNVKSDGTMEGSAWSDNIGWVSFNSGDLMGCPDGACEAKLDKSIGIDNVSGWAKALVGNSYEAGGWDGWMQLDLPGFPGQGVTAGAKDSITNECNWDGWAWGGDLDDDGDPLILEGDEVIGWIDFSGVVGKGGDACSEVVVPRPPNTPPIAFISCDPLSNPKATKDCRGWKGLTGGQDANGDGVFDSFNITFRAVDPDFGPNQLTSCSLDLNIDGSFEKVVNGNQCKAGEAWPTINESLGYHRARVTAVDGAGASNAAEIDFAILKFIKADFRCSLTAGGPFMDCASFKPVKGDSIYLLGVQGNLLSTPSERNVGDNADFDSFQWTSADGSFSKSNETETSFTPTGNPNSVKIKFEVEDELGFKGTEEKTISFRKKMFWREVIPR